MSLRLLLRLMMGLRPRSLPAHLGLLLQLFDMVGGFGEIFIEGQGLAIVEDGLVFMARRFVATAYPVIAIGIGIRDFYGHQEGAHGGVISFLFIEGDAFFEIGV